MLDIEVKIDKIFQEAIDDWRNEPSLDNVKATATSICEDIKALEQDLCTLKGLIQPSSDPDSPSAGDDDTQVINGLPASPPVSPETRSAELNQQSTTSNWARKYQTTVNDFTNYTAAPSAPNAPPIAELATDSSSPGTWVYVPSSSAVKVDLPYMTPSTFGHPCAPEWDVECDLQARCAGIHHNTGNASHSQKQGLNFAVEHLAMGSICREVVNPYVGSERPSAHQDSVLYDRFDGEDAPSPIAPYLDANFDFADWLDLSASQPEMSEDYYANMRVDMVS